MQSDFGLSAPAVKSAGTSLPWSGMRRQSRDAGKSGV